MNSAAGGGSGSGKSSSSSDSSSSNGSKNKESQSHSKDTSNINTQDSKDKKPSTPTYYAQTGKDTSGNRSYTVYDQNGNSIAGYIGISGSQVQQVPGNLTIKPGTQLYNTGGYTGKWVDGDKKGKLAFLHQKELVLNAKDTSNILTAVKSVRSMQDVLSALNTSMQARTGSLLSDLLNHRNTLGNSSNIVQQKVYIDAKFEGQTESSQIEKALDNLVNYASQYAFSASRF